MAEPFTKSLKFFMENDCTIRIVHNSTNETFGKVLCVDDGVVDVREYDAVSKSEKEALFCIALRDINFVKAHGV